MAAKKNSTPQPLSINLLLLTVISVLFVLFVYLRRQHPQVSSGLVSPSPTLAPIKGRQEIDTLLNDINADTAGQLINQQLQGLNSDTAGI